MESWTIFAITKAWRQTPKAVRFFRILFDNDLFAAIEIVMFIFTAQAWTFGLEICAEPHASFVGQNLPQPWITFLPGHYSL